MVVFCCSEGVPVLKGPGVGPGFAWSGNGVDYI